MSDVGDNVGNNKDFQGDELDFSDIVQNGLYMRLAKSVDDILLSQKLRYKIFYEELAADASEQIQQEKRDIDEYDDISDHLLVFDSNIEGDECGQLVGSYRLMRHDQLNAGKKFYTENEYDIGNIRKSFKNLLELGRSCVRDEYRTKQAINLLWRGLSRYITHYNIEAMFGCASFHGTDIREHELAISYLHHYHLAPEHFRPKALPEYSIPIKPYDETAHSARAIMRDIPPLIKGYLRVGSHIGEGVYIDKKFNTIDVCVVVCIAMMSPRYFKHFLMRDEAE